MALDYSLQSFIEKGDPVSASEAASIMLQLVNGLIEVGDLVHRDLKPDNVLFYDRKWKIADFGIARFIIEATAANTLKGFVSPFYAAPEQWRSERATHATDVYALSCIGHFLLTRAAPFQTDHSYAHQHLAFPEFACTDARIKTLISMMARKSPPSRPSLARLKEQLTTIVETPLNPAVGPLGALAHAAAQVALKEEAAQSAEAAVKARAKARTGLLNGAFDILEGNCERLWGKIHGHAPNAHRVMDKAQFECHIGGGSICINTSRSNSVPPNAFKHSKWDVVGASQMFVVQESPQYTWSASLWYMRRTETDDYRWHEVSYWSFGSQQQPFHCSKIEDADYAASHVMHTLNTAFGPIPVDDEKEDEFHERWIWLLANATSGKLRSPSTLPIRSWPPQF